MRIKERKFVFKTRNCVSKTRNCVLKRRNFVLKMMDFLKIMIFPAAKFRQSAANCNVNADFFPDLPIESAEIMENCPLKTMILY